MNGFTTRAVHGVQLKKDVHGTLRTPVYDSVAFEHESARSLQLTFEGKKPAHAYSRISNPTVEDFEQRMKLLSGGIAALAVSSGMAAITNTLLALAEAGSNIITTKYLFGNTLSLFERTMKPWGLEARYVSMTDPADVESTIDNNTRAVFMESITNPQLEVADCNLISEITAKHGVPLIMDNTMMTPYLFNTAKSGVNIEVLSSTKYISGGATSVGGVIIDNGNFDWSRAPRMRDQAKNAGQMAFISSLRQEIYRNVGACMSPHNAYLQSLGLETMSMRIDKSCDNSIKLAKYLQQHNKVRSVHYPGLSSSPYFVTADKQFCNKFGGLLTFNLESREACFSLIDSLKLIRRATNINDNKTLILHPASTIFVEYTEEDRKAMGVTPEMLRLSVGIEDHEDLIEDLERGLETL